MLFEVLNSLVIVKVVGFGFVAAAMVACYITFKKERMNSTKNNMDS